MGPAAAQREIRTTSISKGRMDVRAVLCLLVAALLGLPAAASAHGPTRLKVDESIDIHAAPGAVWAKIQNFNDMSWHPAVIKTIRGVGYRLDRA